MKTKFTLFFLFTFCVMNAQVTKLQELSKGIYVDSKIIRDVNNNIKGYFLVYQTDKIAKETYELEYVILDENLKKVTTGFIEEMKFESFFALRAGVNIDVTFNQNKLLIKFSEVITGGLREELNPPFLRYRILDLQTNKMSGIFVYKDEKFNLAPIIERKLKNSDNQSEKIMFYKDVGLVVNSIQLGEKTEGQKGFLARYNDNFEEVWKYVYEDATNKTRCKEISYLNSDSDILVFKNHYTDKKRNYINENSILLINSKNGKLLNEFVLSDKDKSTYKIVDCEITNEEVIILGNYTGTDKYGFIEDSQNKGIFSFSFDKLTGNLKEKKFLNWDSVGGILNIDKNGVVKDQGDIFIHNILSLKNNKSIVVCETFKSSPITTKNMYFLELSSDFKLDKIFEVSKFKNKFPGISGWSGYIKDYGMFDFIDYQNIEDDEYLFFLNDNEKKSKDRENSTLYGIVSYSDGVFKRQTLNLKTDISTISAYPAKKGYLLLIEDFDEKGKSTEFRLEKINY